MQGLDGMHERGENERRQTTGEEERDGPGETRAGERTRKRDDDGRLARSLARPRARVGMERSWVQRFLRDVGG